MITVLGSNGFIGSHLVAYLNTRKEAVYAPLNVQDTFNKNLGHVIYCIGLTSDFRTRLFDTVEAHVTVLNKVLRRCRFNSLLYLSSTRIYSGIKSASEESLLAVDPGNPDHLYNISKLMGESICLSLPNNSIRVARLSNVVGKDFSSRNFLSALIQEGLQHGTIKLQLAADSAKDYILVEDVVKLLIQISRQGKERIYNVAFGKNIPHSEIAGEIARLLPAKLERSGKKQKQKFPVVSIDRIRREFSFKPQNVLAALPSLVEAYRKYDHH